ncbi:MAG TPA: LptF/LptG family permease [Chthoniobacterales bacterium]|nr:LptF/LptG family permease [Chthoniobacterales bacterium]
MTILDRYVLKKFFVPFLYCILGFVAIWLVFDLTNNGSDFINGHAKFGWIVEFYLSQLPQVIVIILPIGLLLALLYSLTQMSRANEIISMLGAGRSVVRVLIPIFVVGILLGGIMTWLNYAAAPHADKTRKAMLKELNSGKKREQTIAALLFRNREDLRTWYMRKLRIADEQIDDLQIIQQDKKGNILAQYYARDAAYDTARKVWTFTDAKVLTMNKAGDIIKTDIAKEMKISNWSETPWRIGSATMNSDYLSVPELREYLQFNADFPPVRLAPYRTQLENRWAIPLSAIVVVFLAAPMGIVYSRRGILGGVAVAISLFFSLFLFSNVLVAFGKGHRLDPTVAVWSPYALFFIIGLFLLWCRSTNRDITIPKIFG